MKILCNWNFFSEKANRSLSTDGLDHIVLQTSQQKSSYVVARRKQPTNFPAKYNSRNLASMLLLNLKEWSWQVALPISMLGLCLNRYFNCYGGQSLPSVRTRARVSHYSTSVNLKPTFQVGVHLLLVNSANLFQSVLHIQRQLFEIK